MWAGSEAVAGEIWKGWPAAMETTEAGAIVVALPPWMRDVLEKATRTAGADVGGTVQGVTSTQRTRRTVRWGEENSVASMLWVRSVGAGPRNSVILSSR